MTTRMKRTYNLPEPTVKLVREMAEKYVASSQDGVVELAIEELARRVREEEEANAWQRAADDPLFRSELERLEDDFSTADAETWPPR